MFRPKERAHILCTCLNITVGKFLGGYMYLKFYVTKLTSKEVELFYILTAEKDCLLP